MGLFSKLGALSAGRHMAQKNAPTVHKGVDSVASTVSDHLPEQHRSKVGKGASMIKKVLTGTWARSRRMRPILLRHGDARPDHAGLHL